MYIKGHWNEFTGWQKSILIGAAINRDWDKYWAVKSRFLVMNKKKDHEYMG